MGEINVGFRGLGILEGCFGWDFGVLRNEVGGFGFQNLRSPEGMRLGQAKKQNWLFRRGEAIAETNSAP